MTAESTRKTTAELMSIEADPEIDFDFVAREAGDLAMSEGQREVHCRLRRVMGQGFYVELLLALMHVRYPPREAERVWHRVLDNRDFIESRLGRRVGVAVAALDVALNVRDEIQRPRVIPEPLLMRATYLALRDGMTGLLTHSSLDAVLEQELDRVARYDQPLSLLLIDIDHFKRFNDTFGHQAGDEVIRRLAQLLREEVREVDSAARYGGEEFAVVAPSTSRDGALELAERIRARAYARLHDPAVSVSVGVALAPEHAHVTPALIEAADLALYAAKSRGRNCTVLYAPA